MVELVVDWTYTAAVLPTWQVAIWATRPLSPGIASPDRREYRLLELVNASLGSIDILSSWTDRYGPLVPGQVVHVAIETIDDAGLKSGRLFASATIQP